MSLAVSFASIVSSSRNWMALRIRAAAHSQSRDQNSLSLPSHVNLVFGDSGPNLDLPSRIGVPTPVNRASTPHEVQRSSAAR